ncbi:uncharacterized protein [Clinocottus analis]|uniref:uncharacterized protein n=1 Tax=Clinocottus analis TaxID=304258 RepID=UPI0035BF346E
MSQSRETKDNQALLQSMLQRLKLQPGKEAQEYPTHVPTAAASAWGRDGERGASNLQKVNSSAVNGCEFGTNGTLAKEFVISPAESNLMLRIPEIQPPDRGCKVDSFISSHSLKDNIDADTGEESLVGQASQPAITPTGTGQLFPAESLKDADITSFERTDRAKGSSGGSAMTRHISSNNDDVTSTGQNQNQDQSFMPKVFMWSLNPKDANLATQIQENEPLHVGNGGLGALANNKDIVVTNSDSMRKQLLSESKTRRWTQKIKERWRGSPGRFVNKGKKGGTVDQKSKQRPEISPQNLMTAENVINTSNMVEERTLPSLDSRDPSNTPPANTEDSPNEGNMRPTSSNFEFGLGSFSLLEEIVTGQEWARRCVQPVGLQGN